MLTTLALALLGAADRVEGSVYWASESGIGRANLDGEAVAPSFIEGAAFPCGVAVDHSHVYWGNPSGDSIGRADIEGTNADQSFINGADRPCAVAVDGAHVYWANTGDGFGGSTIGRANLDGGGANQSFIDTAAGPCGIAVADAHVYWTNAVPGTIGRAELDGTGVDPSFIEGAARPCGLAVTGGDVIPRHAIVGGHLYWANTGGVALGSSIGRAGLDGSGVDPGFITGLQGVWGVAVSDTHLFWGNTVTGSIGRAYLDGTVADDSFMEGTGRPFGLALDGRSVQIRLGAARKLRGRGVVKLPVTVPGPGTLELARTARVRGESERSDSAEELLVTVRARGHAKRRLEARGRVRIEARVSFVPDGATAITQTVTLRLIRR